MRQGRTAPSTYSCARPGRGSRFGSGESRDAGAIRISEQNVELVRRGFASAEAFWALLDEYVVMDLRGAIDRFPDLEGVYVRRDAIIKVSRHWWGTWTDYRIDAEELIDAGSSVVVVAHERGRGKGSGAP